LNSGSEMADKELTVPWENISFSNK